MALYGDRISDRVQFGLNLRTEWQRGSISTLIVLNITTKVDPASLKIKYIYIFTKQISHARTIRIATSL